MDPSSDPRLSLMLSSYERFVGEPLCALEALWTARFVVLAHGTETPPILFYGNQQALDLWQMPWEQFTRTPSQQTAEPDEREVRARLLARVRKQGFIQDYCGVRISSTGRRFEIHNATVWSILDGDRLVGQAAMFARWRHCG